MRKALIATVLIGTLGGGVFFSGCGSNPMSSAVSSVTESADSKSASLAPYIKAGVSLGGDLGVDYADVLEIFDDMGIGLPATQEMRNNPKIQQGIKDHDYLCGQKYDGFLMYDMITGYGCAAGLDEAWKAMGNDKPGSVVVQGFGCVGASMCNSLDKMGYKIVGGCDQ